MARVIYKILFFCLLISLTLQPVFAQGEQAPKHLMPKIKPIYYFYGDGCPHCAKVDKHFQEKGYYQIYPIEKKEIYFDRSNALLYNGMLHSRGISTDERKVPTIILGQTILVGDRNITENFETEAEKYITNLSEADGDLTDPELGHTTPVHKTKPDLTWAAVVGASIVDAINPCAFAVLIILMTTVLVSGDSKKALKAGLAFATSIFISYFLMGLGIYKALGVGGISSIVYKIVGWLAIILGLFNLKDYFWYGRGFLMEVPMSWRPKMKGLIKSVTSPLGAFGVGFLVSLFLLPCTSGPYIVILGMMAEKMYQTTAVLYLILYNLIFVSPMVLITLAVYKGFNPSKAEEIRQTQLRNLHLIAGLIMLSMGVVILGGWL